MNEQEAKAILMKWLKEIYLKRPSEPLLAIIELEDGFLKGKLPNKVFEAYLKLSKESECELLAEFAAWGLKEGADRV